MGWVQIHRPTLRAVAGFAAPLVVVVGSLLCLAGCATVDKAPKQTSMPATLEQQKTAQQAVLSAPQEKSYKRKIAVGRFSNESNYGRGLLVDADLDPLGKQASDVLVTQLERTGRFIIFERPDLNKVKAEQALSGSGDLVGVDALIMGSVTEFGRATEGKTGFLSSTKQQRVRAKVNLRLVEVSSGRVFFGADGVGEATSESGEVAGFGSRAAYDSTLNEKAIGAAISEVIDELVSELEKRKWRTYVLDVSDGKVYVSGGPSQGLQIGDTLVVMSAGKTVTSRQTGLPIELPGTEVARLRVDTQFGEDEVTEGSVCSVVSGRVLPEQIDSVYITEPEGTSR
jgi:curli biogenesis system outer membrane secretion channel CsgG